MSKFAKPVGPEFGVVTFLDVLGWKGVYDRKPDAIGSLTRLIAGVTSKAHEASRGRILQPVEVKSISDTIAIFTYCSDEETPAAIEVHGELCQWLIPESILSEIPVRGATAYGKFDLSESIFVGKAIDEAASWHEQSDWIGVHLTPSAEYVFAPKTPQTAWAPYSPPHKTKLAWKPHCVNWTKGWPDRQATISQIKQTFRQLGPIVPEIAGKFENTLAFIKTMHAVPSPA